MTADGFRGNCFAFRGKLWTVATNIGSTQNVWWNALQADYNGTYPPPVGGSDPSVTQGQFNAASADMAKIDSTAGTGYEGRLATIGIKYGVTKINVPGPYAWAMNRVFGAAYHLDLAAKAEMKTTASGLDDFHLSQSLLSNSWDALKQLPCH